MKITNRLIIIVIITIITITIILILYEHNIFDINTINLIYDNIDDTIISIKYIKITNNTSASFKIPKVCYQTWYTKNYSQLSQYTLDLINKNKQLNPDIDFQLWDDNDIDQFIYKEFPRSTYEAYKSINPIIGAAKADFFRYCVIYKYGGIYLDLKSMIKIPQVFGNIIQPDDEAILDIRRTEKMPYRKKWNYGSYEQWFLAFSPKHPYLHTMIKQLTHNLNEHVNIYQCNRLKEKILRLTGPDAYSAAIHTAVVQYGIRHREISYFDWLRYRSGRFSEYKYSNRVHYPDISNDISLYTNITYNTSTHS